eukprot:TRINITY_DN27452_c0_g1_i1.p1 TRINITY_DN27452_c0_g1~~TRINITY_DN27452_c0_g1_i1.p1  ORF type:complete len:1117 (-),score=185.70 TRINITY_DN27452_c0_g1_i1:247-3525(-)
MLVRTGTLEEVRCHVQEGHIAKTHMLLFSAAQRAPELAGTVDICKHLIETLGLHANDRSGDATWNQTPLFYAAKVGSTETLEYLVEKQADVQVADKNVQTALFYAAVVGNCANVEKLLALKADPMHRDYNGHTPLFYAVRSKVAQTKCIQLLVDGSPLVDEVTQTRAAVLVSSTRDALRTPLFHALIMGSTIESITCLLDARSEVDAQDAGKQSPIFFAAKLGRADCVDLLLERRATADLKDVHGQTALFYAAWNNQVESCRVLVEKGGADPTVRNTKGGAISTPLEAAQTQSASEIMSIFRKANSSFQPEMLMTDVTGALDGTQHRAMNSGPMRARGCHMRPPPPKRSKIVGRSRKAEVASILDLHNSDMSEEQKNAAQEEAVRKLELLAQVVQHGPFEQVRDLLLTSTGGTESAALALLETPLLHFAALRSSQAAEVCRCLVQDYGHDPNILDTLKRRTALFLAASAGNAAVCTFLIEAKCDVLVQDTDGRTAVFSAVTSFNVDQLAEPTTVQERACQTAMALVDGRADVNVRDSKGRSALFLAIEETRPAMAVTLVAKCGARVPDGCEEASYCVRDSNGNRDLLDMARDRGLPDVLDHLRKGQERQLADVALRERLFRTAAAGRASEIATLLTGGLSSNARSPDGQTALHHAAARSDGSEAEACIGELVRVHGADPAARDRKGQTPLFSAARDGSIQGLGCLLECRCDVGACDASGETAIFEAARQGRIDVVDMLLARGASTTHRNRHQQQTPLFAAVQHRRAAVVRILLSKGCGETEGRQGGEEKGTICAALQDFRGRTALFHALDAESAAALLDARCSVDARDHSGQTALFLAARNGQETVVRLLLDRGARVDIFCSLTPNLAVPSSDNGRNAASKRFGVARAVAAAEAEAEASEACASRGGMALHGASGQAVTRLLLDAGSPSNARDGCGRTPLICAAMRGDVVTARALARAGADVAAVDSSGKGALHHAVKRGGPLDLVRTLLFEALADVSPGLIKLASRTRPPQPAIVSLLDRAMQVHRRFGSDDRGVERHLRYRLRFEDPSDPSGSTPIAFGTPQYEARLKELLVECPWLETSSKAHGPNDVR